MKTKRIVFEADNGQNYMLKISTDGKYMLLDNLGGEFTGHAGKCIGSANLTDLDVTYYEGNNDVGVIIAEMYAAVKGVEVESVVDEMIDDEVSDVKTFNYIDFCICCLLGLVKPEAASGYSYEPKEVKFSASRMRKRLPFMFI